MVREILGGRELKMESEPISEGESKRIQKDLFKTKFGSSEYDMIYGFELAKLEMIKMIADKSAYLNGEFVRTWSEKIRNLRMVVPGNKDKDEMEALKAASQNPAPFPSSKKSPRR